MMKPIYFFALLLLAFNSHAVTYKSEHGFTVKLDNDWIVMSHTNAQKKASATKSLESINISKEKAEKIISRIIDSNVEFLFAKKGSSKDFTNNISIQKGAGATARTPEQAEAACKTLQPELQKLYKETVTVTQCGMITVDGYSFMSYEYKDAIPGVTTIQHEFQFTPNLTFITIGGTLADSAATIRATQKKIAGGIIKLIRSSPDYFKIAEKAIKALQEKKYKTAYAQLDILAKVGDPEGLFNLAVFNEHGKGTTKDLKKAFQYYTKAAEQGHAHAITKLGEYHLNGKGTKKDPEMAAKMFYQAGLMGDPAAQNSFATMLFNGIGVKKKDPAKAMQWFVQSAQQGYPPAARNLIKIYETEIENKNFRAYHPLAMIYLQGVGVEKDSDKAIDYLEKAAFNGVQESRKALYEIYSKGMFGITKNEEKAKAWK